MVRGKKFFTISSIIAMSIMFVTLMCGFVEDGYYSYSYYYTRYYSFANYYDAWMFWTLFGLVFSYIGLGVVAMILYKKAIKAINLVNFIFTLVTYSFALLVSIFAIIDENLTFALMLLCVAIPVAFPLHLIAEILAMSFQKKNRQDQQAMQPVASFAAPQAAPAASGNAIAMLKQLKELYDAGVLSEDEYNEKKQQYVEMI